MQFASLSFDTSVDDAVTFIHHKGTNTVQQTDRHSARSKKQRRTDRQTDRQTHKHTDMLLCRRKLANYDYWSGMVVHVAMDSTVIADDIREFICAPVLRSLHTDKVSK